MPSFFKAFSLLSCGKLSTRINSLFLMLEKKSLCEPEQGKKEEIV
jgi:hypothetical protein